MKKCILIFLPIIFSFTTTHSQYIDSLTRALVTNTHDTIRIFTLLRLSQAYSDFERDSSMQYAQKALRLSTDNEFEKGEAQSLNMIGSILTSTGNYPKAFEFHLDALKIAENLKNVTLIAAIYNNLARVSTERSDYKTALQYLFKAKTAFENLNRQDYVATVLLNIGDTYDRMNISDSAFYFLTKAKELAIQIDYPYLLGAINSNLGHAFVTVNKTDEAADYFRIAVDQLHLSEDKTDLETLAGVYDGIAKIFENRRNKDSALYYAKQSLAISMQVSDQKRILNACKLLQQIYDKEKVTDSAYRYSIIASETREAILGEQRITQLEGLKFNEQLRQQEIAKAELRKEKERKNNLQLIGIVLFIITFFTMLIIVGRRKAHPRALKYMGLLATLLLFEFIALFIHPYIDKLTDHHPVYMLIILVSVAAILVPLHHKMEQWVKEKLVTGSLKHGSLKLTNEETSDSMLGVQPGQQVALENDSPVKENN